MFIYMAISCEQELMGAVGKVCDS